MSEPNLLVPVSASPMPRLGASLSGLKTLLPVLCLTLLPFSCASIERGGSMQGEDQDNHSAESTSEDLETIAGIINRTYAVISGPQGEPRDWDRFLDLFVPGQARLVAVARGAEGQSSAQVLTPEQYVEIGTRQFAQAAFYETGLSHRVERFGSIAHVFSPFESRRDPQAEPFMRGVNSFQLLWTGARWQVLTIFWDYEYPDQPIPSMYLGGSEGH